MHAHYRTLRRPHPAPPHPCRPPGRRRTNATWSPASTDDGTSTLALKRAINWWGSIAVPVGVLGQRTPGAALYATQLSFLKDQTSPAYYYMSPINNGARAGPTGGRKLGRRRHLSRSPMRLRQAHSTPSLHAPPPSPLAGWMKIDVAALSDAREGTWFPVAAAAPQVPFASDVTAGGGAAAQ